MNWQRRFVGPPIDFTCEPGTLIRRQLAKMIANSGLHHSAFEIHQELLCMHSLHLNAADSRTFQYCFLVSPMICDVQRALFSNRDGDIHTLIRNMGLMVMTDAAPPLGVLRWMLLYELMEASGFPIGHEASQASGVQCSCSRGMPSNPRRTRRSLTQQLGLATLPLGPTKHTGSA